MHKILLGFFFFLLVPAFYAYADCLACSELKGISITLKSGKKINGYIEWNDIWSESQGKYEGPMWSSPDSIVKSAKSGKWPVKVYKKIIFFNEVYSNVPFVIEGNVEHIEPSDIKQIVFLPGRYDKTDSTAIQVISSQTAEVLKEKPVAKYCYDYYVSENCFISFNKSYNESDLAKISNEFEKNYDEEKVKKYNSNKVLFFSFGYD